MAITGETIKAGYLKLPDYQKSLISAGVMLVLGGLYFYLLYMPKMEEVKELNIKLSDVQTKVNQVRAVANELPKFKAEHKLVTEKLKKALTQLPSSDEIPTLLINMEKEGNDAGIIFESIVLSKEKKKDFYAEVPIKIKIKSTYHDIGVFFDKISKLPRIINISNIDIGQPKIVEGRLELKVDCLATTYKFIEKAKGSPKKGRR